MNSFYLLKNSYSMYQKFLSWLDPMSIGMLEMADLNKSNIASIILLNRIYAEKFKIHFPYYLNSDMALSTSSPQSHFHKIALEEYNGNLQTMTLFCSIKNQIMPDVRSVFNQLYLYETNDLCLMPADEAEMKPNRVYLSDLNGKIAYSFVNNSGDNEINLPTNINAPTPFDLITLNKLKPLIQKFTMKYDRNLYSFYEADSSTIKENNRLYAHNLNYSVIISTSKYIKQIYCEDLGLESPPMTTADLEPHRATILKMLVGELFPTDYIDATRDIHRRTITYWAEERGIPEFNEQLFQMIVPTFKNEQNQIDTTKLDKNGRTIFYWLILLHQPLETILLLLEQNKKINKKYDKLIKELILLAADQGYVELLNSLTTDNLDWNCLCSLFKFRENHFIELLEKWIPLRADLLNHVSCGQGLFHIATMYSCCKLLNYLIDHGADINLTDAKGKTAMQIALSNPQYYPSQVINLFLKQPNIRLTKPCFNFDKLYHPRSYISIALANYQLHWYRSKMIDQLDYDLNKMSFFNPQEKKSTITTPDRIAAINQLIKVNLGEADESTLLEYQEIFNKGCLKVDLEQFITKSAYNPISILLDKIQEEDIIPQQGNELR